MAPKKREEKKPAEEEEQLPLEDNGTFVFPANSATYTGQIVRSKETGTVKRQGRGLFKDGPFSYDGDWADDNMEGVGKIMFPSGASYAGTIVNNAFDGKGLYKWADGSYYDGQWRFNRMHGEGLYCDAAGQQWTGKFYNGTGPGLRRGAAADTIGTR